MEIEKSVIDRISSLRDLPSLPQILVKLMEACNDENGSLGDIADILKERLVGMEIEGHEASSRISDLMIPMELEKSLLVS